MMQLETFDAVMAGRLAAVHHESRALGVDPSTWMQPVPARRTETTATATDRIFIERYVAEERAAGQDLGLGRWWQEWLGGSSGDGVAISALRNATGLATGVEGVAAREALLRELHDAELVRIAQLKSEAYLAATSHVSLLEQCGGAPALVAVLSSFLEETADLFEHVWAQVGFGRPQDSMADLYRAMNDVPVGTNAASASWALAQIIAGAPVGDRLESANTRVVRGPREPVVTILGYPSRAHLIYLGRSGARTEGLALLHEAAHVIHSELLTDTGRGVAAAFCDPVIAEAWAYFVEDIDDDESRRFRALRDIVMTRVYAVRAVFGITAALHGRSADPLELLEATYELHMGLAPLPADAVSDLFKVVQNVERVLARSYRETFDGSIRAPLTTRDELMQDSPARVRSVGMAYLKDGKLIDGLRFRSRTL